MLTARDEDIDQVLGLEMGADDYLKPVQPRAAAGAYQSDPAPMNGPERPADVATRSSSGVWSSATIRERSNSTAPTLDLTTAEFDLLWLLATNAGRAASQRNSEIAAWTRLRRHRPLRSIRAFRACRRNWATTFRPPGTSRRCVHTDTCSAQILVAQWAKYSLKLWILVLLTSQLLRTSFTPILSMRPINSAKAIESRNSTKRTFVFVEGHCRLSAKRVARTRGRNQGTHRFSFLS